MKTLSRLGFWSAFLTAWLSIAWTSAFVFQLVAFPPAPWGGVESYARSFQSLQMLNLVPALPLGWAYIVMMVAFHYNAPADKRVWSMVALAFAVIYAGMANINYLIQLVAVRPSLLSGETEGLGLFVGDNPHSVFWALANAYAFQSISLFFGAWALRAAGPERWIRRLWIAVGVTAPFQLGYSLGLIPMALAAPVLAVWIVGVPASCFMLAAVFRRMEKGGPAPVLAETIHA